MSLVHIGFVHLRTGLEALLKLQNDYIVCAGVKIHVWDKEALASEELYIRVTFCGRIAPFGKLLPEYRVTCFGCMFTPQYTPGEWRELMRL